MYTPENYLVEIKKRLMNSFVFEEPSQLGETPLELLAVYEEVSGRTFVTQADIIDRLEKYERFHFRYVSHVTVDALETLAGLLADWANAYNPGTVDHMSTTLTAIVYGEKIDEECFVWLKKFKYTKFYAYAMNGWCDIRFVVVDLCTEKVQGCKLSKRVLPVFDVNVKSLRKKRFITRLKRHR